MKPAIDIIARGMAKAAQGDSSEVLAEAKQYTDTALQTAKDYSDGNLQAAKTYTDNSVIGLPRLKGSVATYDDLPVSNMVIGDTYIAEDTHLKWSWASTSASGSLSDYEPYYDVLPTTPAFDATKTYVLKLVPNNAGTDWELKWIEWDLSWTDKSI